MEKKTTVPKILHQIWIGDLEAPLRMMNTWKEKHPEFEYIFWNEAEIEKRGIVFKNQSKIDIMKEINGKADIMRWEILYEYGGYFVDADSICIEPFDDYFENKTGFATYENEFVRSDLIATGTMGFIPKHQLCKDIIEWISMDEFDNMNESIRAWGTVGPGLLTRFLKTGNYKNFSVYPSHCFLPIHFTGLSYKGHKKVYAYQAWGTSNKNYDKMNTMELPPLLREPKFFVSILMPVFNTSFLYLKECLESIKCQNGYFGIELVCINDGSDEFHTNILEKLLADFKTRTRFTKVVYQKLDKHYGVTYAQNKGVLLCTNELIFRMDSDDIMLPDRMKTQIEFMKNNDDCVICGANIQLFYNDTNDPKKKILDKTTNHPRYMTWNDYMATLPNWFMNQPTFCMRKSAVLSVGNYNIDRNTNVGEDYELELRLLHKYGKIYNIHEVLVWYRIHPKQLTYQHNSNSPEMVEFRKNVINELLETN